MEELIEKANFKLIDNFAKQLTTDNPIFHFTSVAGFKSIIDSKELWLTDTQYLNDYSEIVDGMKLVESCFDEYSKTEFFKFVKQTEYQRIMFSLIPSYVYRTFVFSFSEYGDSKTQWAEYGDNYSGISIGFDIKKLFYKLMGMEYEVNLIINKKLEIYKERLLFGKVIYSKKRKEELLRSYIGEVIEIAESFNCKKGKEDIYTEIFTSMYYKLIKVLPLMKNEGFSDENEYRLIIQFPYRELQMTVANIKELRYRLSDEMIIPYYQLKIEDFYSYISKIIIGPKYKGKIPDITIKEYCESAGLVDVDIQKSSLPIQ